MSAVFNRAMRFVAHWEGGWSRDSRDRGGTTRFGVSMRFLLGRALDLNRDGRIDEDDLRWLTPDRAKNVYREHFWNHIEGDQLPAGLSLAVYDASINQGVTRASRFLQKAVGVNNVDGDIGPATLAQTQRAWAEDPKKVLRNFCVERALHYSALSQMVIYGRGWFNRLFACQQAALEEIENARSS